MKKAILLGFVALALCGCHTKEKEARAASGRVETAYQLTRDGNLNAAKRQLDSVHMLYPRQVEARRAAKALMDSIVYIEAIRTEAYSDSLLQPLLPQADALLKKFTHEKNETYEDKGRYVHRLLTTSRNTARCFLQGTITEQGEVMLKSYYYGASAIGQEGIELASGEEVIRLAGTNHAFQAEGWHEILSLTEEAALQGLEFVSAHAWERIRVKATGEKKYHYYLSDTERQALAETWHLAVLMKDIERLERQANAARRQIAHYEEKYAL